jgi:hypothetical protein
VSGLGLGVQALKLAPKEQAQRFAIAVVASVIAVTLILPFGGMHNSPHSRDDYIRIALLPAAAAWLIVWRTPGSHGIAMFRTAMLAIALVGAGGLGLLAVSGTTSPWIEETVKSPQFLPQALVYIGLGAFGVIVTAFFSGNDE